MSFCKAFMTVQCSFQFQKLDCFVSFLIGPPTISFFSFAKCTPSRQRSICEYYRIESSFSNRIWFPWSTSLNPLSNFPKASNFYQSFLRLFVGQKIFHDLVFLYKTTHSILLDRPAYQYQYAYKLTISQLPDFALLSILKLQCGFPDFYSFVVCKWNAKFYAIENETRQLHWWDGVSWLFLRFKIMPSVSNNFRVDFTFLSQSVFDFPIIKKSSN